LTKIILKKIITKGKGKGKNNRVFKQKKKNKTNGGDIVAIHNVL
jgi:hypothetical protein